MTLKLEKLKKECEQTKTTVLAYMNQQEYDYFIAPNENIFDWPFEIEMFDSKYPVEDFIQRLNKDKKELFLTAWSTPRLPDDIVEKAPGLKYVSHICGAVAFFMPRVALEKGLVLTNWGHLAGRSVAEHCLLQILACLRRAAKWQIELHMNKKWREGLVESYTLFEKRIGIYGFGACARELIKILAPFNCDIKVYSDGVPDDDYKKYDVEKAQSLEYLFRSSEIVVNVEALTPLTFGTITEELLRMMPSGGVFVSAGRGDVVDEYGLINVLRDGSLQAALDVYEKEPLPLDSPLRGMKNVFLTPHIAGPTTDERALCGKAAMMNVAAYLQDRPVENIIRPEKYDRMSKL